MCDATCSVYLLGCFFVISFLRSNDIATTYLPRFIGMCEQFALLDGMPPPPLGCFDMVFYCWLDTFGLRESCWSWPHNSLLSYVSVCSWGKARLYLHAKTTKLYPKRCTPFGLLIKRNNSKPPNKQAKSIGYMYAPIRLSTDTEFKLYSILYDFPFR